MENYSNPIERLIYSTVRIECKTKEGNSSGSGYFFSFLDNGTKNVPCIVTNKHVIKGAYRGKFHLTLKDSNGKPNLNVHIPIEFNNFENMWILHPDVNTDLAIFPLGPILNEAETKGINFFYTLLTTNIIASEQLLKSLSSMEDIIMIGYPNGIWDEKHNLPIIRKGITATHSKLPYNGKSEFMIDAACFPGSSGSPVFLANIGSFLNEKGVLCAGTRIALLGTLYAGPQHTVTGDIKIVNIPTDTKPISVLSVPNNLGLVIQSKKLLDFERILQKLTEDEINNTKQ
ncbi:S1 family peptidase [Tenacibaculum finnmarkense]|uniref:S1 family peptidase n=1 Tax=Tenacibaculum finnmarkense TaxID=2781243 RepID=UPI00187B706C|nr:serine protease [Tenacibaculum finnmarkense]MBE7692094.1 serine protease [Tenacibaculum finnmarkense genomovar finnmarkense]